VETSNNLAAANPSQDGSSYKIVMSSRSSIGSALESQRAIIAKAAKLCGASCAQDNAYPGWAPNPSSKIVKLTQEVMEAVTGSAPKVREPPSPSPLPASSVLFTVISPKGDRFWRGSCFEFEKFHRVDLLAQSELITLSNEIYQEAKGLQDPFAQS